MAEVYATLLSGFVLFCIICFLMFIFKLLFGHRYADDYYQHYSSSQTTASDSEECSGGYGSSVQPGKQYNTLKEYYRDQDSLKRINEKYLYGDTSEPMTVRETEFLFRENLSALMEKSQWFQENPGYSSRNGETVESLKGHILDLVNCHKEKYGYVDWDVNRMPERFDGTVEQSDRNWNDHRDYFFKDQEEYNRYYGLSNEDYKYGG